MTNTLSFERSTVEESLEAEVPPALILAESVPFHGPRAAQGSARASWKGHLPEWLRGTLVRTAPMFGASTAWEPKHWFDALALVFGVALEESGAALQWAQVESETARTAALGRTSVAHFGTKNDRTFWTRLRQPIPEVTDNPNVNVVRMGSDLVAMTESPHQWTLDARTFRARTRTAYHDAIPRSAIMLAHPIVAGGQVTNLAYTIGPRSNVMLYTHPAASRSRTLLAQWSTRELPYIHSFGLTDSSAIVVGHPFTMRPSPAMLWSNKGVADLFAWRPKQSTRLVLLDRHAGPSQKPLEYETDAFFTFHVVHAFDTREATVIDLLAYDDAGVVAAGSTENLVAHAPLLNPKLIRLSIDRRSGRVKRELLTDSGFEFPQVDWKMARGGSEAFVHGTQIRRDATGVSSTIVRVDVAKGTTQSFSEGDWVFGEPLFVGKPGRTKEGEGVLLAVGTNQSGSTLFVLDATTLDRLAHSDFAVPLPLGFHGTFVPS